MRSGGVITIVVTLISTKFLNTSNSAYTHQTGSYINTRTGSMIHSSPTTTSTVSIKKTSRKKSKPQEAVSGADRRIYLRTVSVARYNVSRKLTLVKIRVSAVYPLFGHVWEMPQSKILQRYKFPSCGNFEIERDSWKGHFWRYGNAVSS